MSSTARTNSSAGPPDWPEDGAIDLALHDLPHPRSPTEWWYLNAHLETEGGIELSVFVSFFRIITRVEDERAVYGHSLVWGVTDVGTDRFWGSARIDPDAPRLGLEKLDRGEGTRDPRLRRAVREILERGRVPYPDRMLDGEVRVDPDRLDLDFAGATLQKRDDGRYALTVPATEHEPGCDLVFELAKPPIRHGDNGVVPGADGADMFYYFVPRCRVSGSVRVDGVTAEVNGDGWYDHEFGLPAEREHETPACAWTWLALQLDNGTEITAYDMKRVDDGESVDRRAILIGVDGTRRELGEFELQPMRNWRSTRTFNDYPTAWRLTVPDAAVEIEILACIEDQEVITLISRPAFWEGRCQASGTHDGASVTGTAFIERSGYATIDTLEDFFGAVGERVRQSVHELLPREVPYEKARSLIASEERDHYMRGVDLDDLSRALAHPVREITDRGGKAWRSYAALACCDIVGGDSRKYVHWLAMPEFLHVGSLIVDDVEDGSDIRRGGPACHHVFGSAIAINAGSACYFMGQKLLFSDTMSDAEKLAVYDLYFEALRAGHAGQALDLHGLTAATDVAVESGDGTTLEQQILAIYRLKTAVPAASLARMGAVVGGGSREQIEALGEYFEALGVAFQIMDDVLNLRGFKGDLKTRGEDLMRGLVTLPVAKAISRMQPTERHEFWATLRGEPREREVVDALIDQLEGCDAIESCTTQARDMVEDAWRRLEPQVEDSLPKIMIRAFGWFVLERHY